MRNAFEKEILKIKNANRHGLLVPQEVVEFARNPKTALHARFNWEDSEAAEQWRLFQARNLIRVLVRFEPHTEKVHREFVSLKSDRVETGGGYRPLNVVMSREAMRQELLEMFLVDIRRLEEKYGRLQELAAFFETAKKVLRKVKTKQGRQRRQFRAGTA